MSKINDGGPAREMTLRDHFATAAMQAMVSSYRKCDRGDMDGSGMDLYTPERNLLLDYNKQSDVYEGAKEISDDAFIIADAMLDARGLIGGAA